jgi:hypothetical protein
MSTVVQSSYRPQITPGVAGMIVNELSSSVSTRICNTAAGIGFGLAVSQDPAFDKAVALGGTAFFGVSVRDVTLDRLPLNPLAPDGTLLPVDTYAPNQNMGVLSRGDIWVTCYGAGEAGVKAGDALYYDPTSGRFCSSGGQAATGSITFTSQPAAGDTLVVTAGTASTWTWVTALTTGNQLLIGQTLGDSIANAARTLEASADTATDQLTYAAFPPSPGGSGQGSGANTLMYAAETAGVAANAYTVVSNTAGTTNSGAGGVLAGGTASPTAVSGGFWKSAAIAGQVAKISLGIQR